MVNMEKFVPTNTNSVTFEFDSSAILLIQMIFFAPDEATFPRAYLNQSGGHSLHQEYCNTPESKKIKDQAVVLNHPFFFDCFQEHLPLNSILAVHLKSGDIVKAIIRSFENGDRNNSSNNTLLSPTA